MKLDFSLLNWQHYIIMGATAVGGTATGIAAKADAICASASNVAACISSVHGWCTTATAISVAIMFVFGHTSPSIVMKKDAP